MSTTRVDLDPKSDAAHMEFQEKPAVDSHDEGHERVSQPELVIDAKTEKRIKYVHIHTYTHIPLSLSNFG